MHIPNGSQRNDKDNEDDNFMNIREVRNVIIYKEELQCNIYIKYKYICTYMQRKLVESFQVIYM